MSQFLNAPRILKRPWAILLFYTVAAVVFTTHKFLISKLNNFIIFTSSFSNLVQQKNLYTLHPESHHDYFKYSPTFATLIAPFSFLPSNMGVILWNILNAVLLFTAIYLLLKDSPKKYLVLWIVLPELITSLQNSQSNALVAAIMLLVVVAFESKYFFWGCFLIILGALIKPFVLALILLLWIYPQPIKNTFYLMGWTLALVSIPLLYVNVDQLVYLYQEWFALLRLDNIASKGISVMGILKSWFSLNLPNTMVQLVGGALLMIPLLRKSAFRDITHRSLMVASILIWVIIFNHKAESPTFIIAVAGVALWYGSIRPTAYDTFLLVSTLILTSLSPTDFFPEFIRSTYVIPYVLKAVPCILIWMRIQQQLLFRTSHPETMLKNLIQSPS